MPRPKKRSRENTAVENQGQNLYCCRCGKEYSHKKGHFPVSHSFLYRGSGYLPFCNECVDKMYDYYVKELGDGRAAMRRMCMKMDMYWSDGIYNMVEKNPSANSVPRSYIAKTNISRYIDKTYDDTIAEEANRVSSAPQPYLAGGEDSAESLDQSIIDFWGVGFTPDFYEELERKYQEWTGGDTEKLSPAEKSLYKQICMQEAIISRDLALGKPVDKSVALLNNLLGSMNLKPAQKKDDTDLELEKMPLGVGIQKWEFERPLPETKKKYRDVNGIVKYVTTWYLGHACKMVGLKNSYTKAYEEAMEKYRVKRPEYEDEDDDTVLNDVFGGKRAEEGE